MVRQRLNGKPNLTLSSASKQERANRPYLSMRRLSTYWALLPPPVAPMRLFTLLNGLGPISACRSFWCSILPLLFWKALFPGWQRLPVFGRDCKRWRNARPGKDLLAPRIRHLRCSRDVYAWTGAPVCAQRPSGTVLFQSMARSSGPSLGRSTAHRDGGGWSGRSAGTTQGGRLHHRRRRVNRGRVRYAGRRCKLGAVCETLTAAAIAPDF